MLFIIMSIFPEKLDLRSICHVQFLMKDAPNSWWKRKKYSVDGQD